MLTVIAALSLAAGDASCPAATAAGAPLPVDPSVVLARDTPVELMAIAEVSTAKAYPGMTFRLRVHRPIEVDGRIVIPVGTPAYGEVLDAKGSAALGKSGRMNVRLICIRYGDVAIPLEGSLSAKGTGAGSAGVAVLLSGWMGLFHRGNNAKIKAGEILSAYVAVDVPLGAPSPAGAPPAGPLPSGAAPGEVPATAATAAPAATPTPAAAPAPAPAQAAPAP